MEEVAGENVVVGHAHALAQASDQSTQHLHWILGFLLPGHDPIFKHLSLYERAAAEPG